MRKEIFFKIYTPYGDYFDVSKDGEIARGSYGTTHNIFSGNWKIKGLKSVKSNFEIPFYKISKELIASTEMVYKNRNPKFTVIDLDHGTTRIWGNTVAHGVSCIIFNS